MREQGIVRRWNNDFGFITSQTGENVFVHFSAIQGDGYKRLSEGALVEFDVTKTAKGLRAENLTVVPVAAASAG